MQKNNSDYLKAMGIEVWQSRSNLQTSLSCHCLLLKNNGAIIADYQAENAAAEKQLLQAIAKALGSEVNAQVELWHALSQSVNEFDFIIAMGDVAALLAGQSVKVIDTFSPAHLLQQPKDKAITWNLIKPYKL